MIGAFQATVVSDGPLALGEPSVTLKGMAKDEIGRALTDNCLSPDKIILEQNILVLNTGSRLVMFDSGMGTAKMFGATTGRARRCLEEARIRPAAIDDIICTHAQFDHVGGLADAKSRRYFPNATIHIAKADYDFWTDEK